MLKRICSLVFSFVVISDFLSAGNVDYNIQDIGTLQTHSSRAIAINNQSQILGWYNIDDSPNGKHFFIRDPEGVFQELPSFEQGTVLPIDWKYLTDEGKAYGIFDQYEENPILFEWNQINGLMNLGKLPGKEISAINNKGQVLIKSIIENENGNQIICPVIWKNGKITKLKSLSGDLGIESGEAYGFGLNNNGDVIGQSAVLLSYKNKTYRQFHATIWIDEQPIDLHDKMPRSLETIATAINDLRDVLIEGMILRSDETLKNIGAGAFCNKMTNSNICYKNQIYDIYKNITITTPEHIVYKIRNTENLIWLDCIEFCSINEKGEVIAKGTTIYGEEHAMLLTPETPESK